MYATKNPVILFTQIFAISSVVIFPILFMLVRQQFIDDQPFTVIFAFSCIIGLICSGMLLFKFELPKYAFPGIAIHLFALCMIGCY